MGGPISLNNIFKTSSLCEGGIEVQKSKKKKLSSTDTVILQHFLSDNQHSLLILSHS